MIVVTLGGGLGNQLFQYAMGRQLSLQRSCCLKLYISNFKYEINRSYKLNHFTVEENFATEKEVEKLIGVYYSNTLHGKTFRKFARLLPKHKRTYFIEGDNWIHEPGVFKISGNVLLEGFWQHYSYYENLPAEILNEITLKKQYQDNENHFLKKIDIDNSSVAVHIRRGDYLSDINNLNFFGVIALDYYQNAIKYMVARIEDPTFYIFSDDLNWAKDHLKINVPMVFVDIDNGTKEFLELEAMSRCRHNIIANSSFSWWGAFLNKNFNKIVIGPKHWVVDKQLNDKIQILFPGWIKL